MKFILLGIRLVLGVLFVSAAYAKIRYPIFFAYSSVAYDILPESLVTLVAVTLPWVELLTGLALLLGVATRTCAAIALCLYTGFILSMFSALFRGLEVNCGCYAGWSPADWSKVLLDIVLGAACCALMAKGPGAFALRGDLSSLHS